MINVNKSNIKLLLCCIVLSFIIISCKKKDEKGAHQQMKPKITPVTSSTVMKKDIPIVISAVGNAEAYSTVSINSKISGRLEKIYFKEGDKVSKGTLLALVDPKPLEASLKQAEANLMKDKTNYENAALQAKRYEELVKKGYVAQADYDTMKASAESLKAVLDADKAAIENIKVQLGYCYIHSPINGVAGSIQIDQGNIVKENDKTIVVINQIDPIYVAFTVQEQQIGKIRDAVRSKKVKVYAANPQDNEIISEGELSFIDNNVDKSTGTIIMKAKFNNKELKLWPGLFVAVTIHLGIDKDAMVVENQVVQSGQKGQYLYLIRDNMTVELKPVKVTRNYQNWSVIEKGVTLGDKVVLDGQLRLFPGAVVEIKMPKEQPKSKEDISGSKNSDSGRNIDKGVSK